MKKSFKTKGKIFIWQAENGVGWCFVYIDKDTSEQIRETLRKNKVQKVAFGSVRTQVTIGSSTWNTSLFPNSKNKVYMLPVKASVRKKEGIEEGDLLDISLLLA
jgi:hypothetical protein